MKKEKKVWALTLLAFWWLSPNQSNAQQQTDSIKTTTLDEVVVTATRTEQPIIEVPRSVSVISKEMIRHKAYNSLGELLATEAGVYVVGSGQTPGTNQSVFLRGANSNQVVVLIDGLRVTDPSSPNGAIDLSEISLAGVERVELIRGAHSSLFGGSAVGGAINIVTRKESRDGFHGDVSLQPGSLGNGGLSVQGDVNLQYRFLSGWYLQGGVFSQRVKGLNATVDTVAAGPGKYKTADDDDFTKLDFTSKAGFRNEKWDVFLSARNSFQRAEIDDGAYNDDDNAYLEYDRMVFGYNASYAFSPMFKLGFAGSLSPSRRYLVNDSSFVDTNKTYDRTFVENTYHGKTQSHEVVMHYNKGMTKGILGAGQYREKMDFNTFYFSNAFGFPFTSKVDYDTINTSAITNYVFAQVTLKVEKFNVGAGTRLSHHSRFGNFWTFELNPSYQLQNMLFYGSVSTGYNAPTLYQLFDPSRSFGSTVSRGNIRLKPETSLSVEVGAKREFANGSHVTVSAYSSTTKDNIEYVNLWNRETSVEELSFNDYINDLYINVASQKVVGIELAARLNIGKFYVQGNVTRIYGEVTVDPGDVNTVETQGHHVQLYNYGVFLREDVTVNTLARRPRFTAFSEVGCKPNDDLTVLVAYRHLGGRNDVEYNSNLGPYGALDANKVARYNLIDFATRYRLNESVHLAFQVENLFDTTYSEINGFQTRGRSFYLKAGFRW
jgi:vitamin B12 transporter